MSESPQRILLIGSGGREHAFAWKLSQSPLCEALFIAPGNPGTASLGTNLPLDPDDAEALAQVVKREKITLVIVGPEAPLVAGVADLLQEEFPTLGLIGPGKAGAELEASKAFTKSFLLENNIPTGAYRSFTHRSLADGQTFLETLSPPYVLKADGLAAGKGVLIIEELAEAKAALAEMLDGKFGAASETVVIEEYLHGIELSVFVLTDGNEYRILGSAKDYKRIGEGDTGPNTGGMGAVSPVPFLTDKLMENVATKVVEPTLAGLKQRGIPYQGFLFLGLMVKGDEPQVIEYNVRMGDPETQVVLPRIESDLVELFVATAQGRLSEVPIVHKDRFAVTTVLAAEGYPEAPRKGDTIGELPTNTDDLIVFHAGTKSDEGKLLTNGGRVLTVTAMGPSLDAAREASQAAARSIEWKGRYYRQDIGLDLMMEEKSISAK